MARDSRPGEHIYEVSGSRRIHLLAPDDVITPAQAAAALAPLVDAGGPRAASLDDPQNG